MRSAERRQKTSGFPGILVVTPHTEEPGGRTCQDRWRAGSPWSRGRPGAPDGASRSSWARPGATVYVTGRSTRERRSEYDRPETIEETAELVTEAGGRGIAVPTDHLEPAQVRALVGADRRTSRAASTSWSTTSGAARSSSSGTRPVWEHDLDNGLRLLRLAVETHAVTSHHALPLLLRDAGRTGRRDDRRHRRVQPRHLPRARSSTTSPRPPSCAWPSPWPTRSGPAGPPRWRSPPAGCARS